MNWSVSKAKAKLSEVLARSRRAPQVIESRGDAVAVVVSKQEFDRLQELARAPAPSPMSDWLEWVADFKRGKDLELEVPPRKVERDRALPFDDER
jgi:prevent-host-death family protein